MTAHLFIFMSKISITVDERERALWDIMQTMAPQYPNIRLSKTVLPLGDISIGILDPPSSEDQDAKGSKEIFLVERKTIADLLASIKDGRYVEQSHRLQHAIQIPRHRVLYLVEGILQRDHKLFFGATTSLQCFKGFSIFRTFNVQETAQWLFSMCDKLARELFEKKATLYSGITNVVANPDENSVEGHVIQAPVEDYCAVVKRVKKENLTPEVLAKTILCQIPGVSSVSAIAIIERHKSIKQLIDALVIDANVMDEIRANGRRLGKNVIENVRQCLLYQGLAT